MIVQGEGYTLYRGDCLEVMAGLDGPVDVSIADPPYGINYRSNREAYNGVERKRHRTFGPDTYITEWMPLIYDLLKSDAFMVVFCRWDVLNQFRLDGISAGFQPVQRLLWDKLHWGMGDLRYYGDQAEDAILFRKGEPSLLYQQRRGNIWRYPSKAYMPEGVTEHPAQKPIGVIRKWIEDMTPAGGTVIDPFMGSGSTGVAAIQTGRQFVGIEIDAGYFAIAHKRIEDAARAARGLPKLLTGQPADAEGMPLFAEVAE